MMTGDSNCMATCLPLQVANIDWCKGPDRGLPAPDIVFFLKLSPEAAQKRANFGEERYERVAFQEVRMFVWAIYKK